MDKRAVTKEHKRLEALLDRADVPTQQCHYDNGGGQTGERENPIFKAYINLWRAYMVGLEKYTSYLPKELQEEAAGDSLSVLDQVKQMKKGSA